MFEPVTRYIAVIETRGQGRGIGQDFAVYIEYASGNLKVDMADAAAFTAWLAMLETGKATFDVGSNQLRVES